MGVYIKGMKMPKDCDCCDFCEYEQGQCLASDYKNTYPRVKGKRPEWCPLIEVKTPHGRLIDEERLKAYIYDYASDEPSDMEEDIDDMPTVIEAEESE